MSPGAIRLLAFVRRADRLSLYQGGVVTSITHSPRMTAGDETVATRNEVYIVSTYALLSILAGVPL